VLDELQFGRTPTTFFLLNGFQLKGILLHYDDEVLIVESGGKKQMLFQQAISTISPTIPIDFPNEY
jgi:host factor-I protein